MSDKELFQSEIFPAVPFTGYVKEESPDGVTLREECMVPASPDTLKINYAFPHFNLEVRSDKYTHISISTADLMSAHMWDQDVRDLYKTIDYLVKEVTENKINDDFFFTEYNVGKVSSNPIDSQKFVTNIAYTDWSKEVDESKLEEYFSLIPCVKREGGLEEHETLLLHLENGMRFCAYKTVLGTELNFVGDQRHTKEDFDSLIESFDPESKGWHNDLRNENTRGTDFRFSFNPQYFRMPFLVFEDDVKQLPVIAFGKQSPYL